MKDFYAVALLSIFTGFAGTGLGGLAGVLIPSVPRRVYACLLHGAAGLMLAIITFELLPEALSLSSASALSGMCAGMGVMFLAEGIAARSRSGNKSRATGLLLLLGVALHNLPEGLAVGAGFADAPLFGMALCLMIVLHDVPEGLAMALPMREGGTPSLRILGLSMLAGLPTVLGTLLGHWLGRVAPGFLAFCLALAGGAMLAMTFQDLLPEARKKSAGRLETAVLAAGLILGAVISRWL